MEMLIIPQADTIPVAWGWLHFLLLLTFPLHLLAMNAMVGGLAIAIYQHFFGGETGRRLAHRIAIALPLVIAFVVNFGVAPLLLVQVLYGQFLYTSSILMGFFWILVVPILLVAYYLAYLYDFRFTRLGKAAPWIAMVVFALFLLIAFFYSGNMLLMTLPERFTEYLNHRGGTFLSFAEAAFWPRFLHMVLGALAVGGLFVVLLGRLGEVKGSPLAVRSENAGMQTFFAITCVNILVGIWYLLSLQREQMMLFMGGNYGATIAFVVALLLVCGALWGAWRKRFMVAFFHAIAVVVLMTFMRSWLRSSQLEHVFTLDQLEVVPQYGPMIIFFVSLAGGCVCLAWLVRKTVLACVDERKRDGGAGWREAKQ
ncbi:MAG: hypothetical protein V2I36_15225 [Desulfopila sp.]|jgi:hypothetical protein|nr:hypothetical protein [Desulfopila sp.]